MSGDHSEYAGFVRRAIRGYGRRVAEADDADLAEMVQLRSVLEGAIAAAVLGQRERLGRSWSEVARGLGTSKQAAYERYGGQVGQVRPHEGVDHG